MFMFGFCFKSYAAIGDECWVDDREGFTVRQEMTPHPSELPPVERSFFLGLWRDFVNKWSSSEQGVEVSAQPPGCYEGRVVSMSGEGTVPMSGGQGAVNMCLYAPGKYVRELNSFKTQGACMAEKRHKDSFVKSGPSVNQSVEEPPAVPAGDPTPTSTEPASTSDGAPTSR